MARSWIWDPVPPSIRSLRDLKLTPFRFRHEIGRDGADQARCGEVIRRRDLIAGDLDQFGHEPWRDPTEIEHLRAAFRAAASDMSPRDVADDAQLSHTVVYAWLGDADLGAPQARTVASVRAWVDRQRQLPSTMDSLEKIEAAEALLDSALHQIRRARSLLGGPAPINSPGRVASGVKAATAGRAALAKDQAIPPGVSPHPAPPAATQSGRKRPPGRSGTG